MRRVVVTGLGVISALGNNRTAFEKNLRAGHCAIGPFQNFQVEDLTTRIGAEVSGFDPLAHFSDKQLVLLDRCAQFALVTAREAAEQSGLSFKNGKGRRAAAIYGTGIGSMTTLDESFKRYYRDNSRRIHPLSIPKAMISSSASHVSMEFGITGPAFMVSSACASANHAIGLAFHMVRSGAVDAALTGGTEAIFTYGTVKSWEAMRILAPDTCRPFSLDRKGLVLGEGAASFMLEEYESARARGAEILGEIAGFGMSADASDIVLPSVDGASAAIEACLEDAGLAADQVDYINAHGTGTAMNDVTETKALHKVFGAHARKLAVSSTKAMHGHALGATGAIELAAVLQSMRGGYIPPTVNYTTPDPQCDLDYVPNEVRAGQINTAVSNSFAFGGLNAVLAVRRV